MGCVLLPPFPPPPNLPAGFSFAPFTPPFINVPKGICCTMQALTFPTPAIPIVIPAAAINAAVAVFTNALAAIQAAIDGVIPPCPKS